MSEKKKTGPKGGRDTPVNGARVRLIVQLRDGKGMQFPAIAKRLSNDEGYEISTQGVFALYKRWRPWAIKTERAMAKMKEVEAALRAARNAARSPVKKAVTKKPVKKAAAKKPAKKAAK